MSRWGRVAGTALAWRWWGAEAVVYDPNTGDTHVLDAISAEVLRRVDGAFVAADALVADLTGSLGLSNSPDLDRSVRAALDRFAALQLIEPVE